MSWSLGALILVASSGLGVAAAGGQEKASPPPDIKVEDCRTCHDTAMSNSFLHSKHAGLAQSCASCHEGAAEHAKGRMEGNDAPGPSLKNKKASEVNSVCLTCHEKNNQSAWMGGAHERRGVSCTSCHAVHDFKSAKSQLKNAVEPETCYSCHTAIRAQGLRTSHHPVREGLMNCSSCHNPHDGSRPKMIKAEWTNELCLNCHTEKRGPFFWEHAPVRENCLNCHNPHGSNHDKLLVAQQPWLCQRCHLNTRHPGTFYTGINAGTTVTSASNRAVEHACKNCHQSVHGGNAPTAPYLGR